VKDETGLTLTLNQQTIFSNKLSTSFKMSRVPEEGKEEKEKEQQEEEQEEEQEDHVQLSREQMRKILKNINDHKSCDNFFKKPVNVKKLTSYESVSGVKSLDLSNLKTKVDEGFYDLKSHMLLDDLKHMTHGYRKYFNKVSPKGKKSRELDQVIEEIVKKIGNEITTSNLPSEVEGGFTYADDEEQEDEQQNDDNEQPNYNGDDESQQDIEEEQEILENTIEKKVGKIVKKTVEKTVEKKKKDDDIVTEKLKIYEDESDTTSNSEYERPSESEEEMVSQSQSEEEKETNKKQTVSQNKAVTKTNSRKETSNEKNNSDRSSTIEVSGTDYDSSEEIINPIKTTKQVAAKKSSLKKNSSESKKRPVSHVKNKNKNNSAKKAKYTKKY
jgi:hypothetical protein